MSLERFSRRIRVRGANLSSEVNRVVTNVALVVDQVLVLSTPVDTGRARSNWLVSLSGPQTNEIAPYAPGEKLGRGETINAQAALNQGRDALLGRRPGQTIFIANNVFYIGRLNEGSSAQAPAMFVEAAVAAGVAAVAGARLDTGKGL